MWAQGGVGSDLSSCFDEDAGGPSAFVAGGAVAFDVDLVGSAVRAGRFLFLRFEINLFYLAVSFLFISLGVFIDAQDVAAAAAVAECCDALASAFPCIHVNLEDIFRSCIVLQVDGTGNGVVYILLHDCLELHAVIERHFMAFYDPRETFDDFFIGQVERKVVVFKEVLDAVRIDAEAAVYILHGGRTACIPQTAAHATPHRCPAGL